MRYLLVLLSVAGIAVSALALQAHYSTATALSSVNDQWDCSFVNRSSYSVIFNVPVAAIGIGGYLLLGVLALARRRILLPVAALMGLCFSLRLSGIEREILSAWCLYCAVSQAIIVLIAAFSATWLVAWERSKSRARRTA